MHRSSLKTQVPIQRRPESKLQGWRRHWRYYYYRLLRLQGTPDAIARGVACGVFAGSFPWLGLQIVIAVVLATATRGNKIAAAAATWVSNPFTYVPIFAFNFKVGQWITGWHDFSIDDLDWTSSEIWHLGANFLGTMMLGCALVGVVAAIGSYVLSVRLISELRHRHKIGRR
ncbi:DUF2062 domain-containing protein [Oscillatoria sp. FACHB-1406]|uniref:DUF2062 domain-containing protein n=1 Tax=Oscillatoria sp. FACHB-1406 TaxID=2692846 RepID=UPI0016833FFE|nr:DUF2062 domain-containing protein [Oscillatoria sp. FACHB-1406]MBD2580324.1 DUF2062 domain-containing protein [Oscillatoria sp. FACHB-1406]